MSLDQALMLCRDCYNPCSSSAKSCPKCGREDPTGRTAEEKADFEVRYKAVEKSNRRWTLGCFGLIIVVGLSFAFCEGDDDPNHVSFDERLDKVNEEREKYNMPPLSPREYKRREKGWSKILPHLPK